jgi:hypothetical protein
LPSLFVFKGWLVRLFAARGLPCQHPQHLPSFQVVRPFVSRQLRQAHTLILFAGVVGTTHLSHLRLRRQRFFPLPCFLIPN